MGSLGRFDGLGAGITGPVWNFLEWDSESWELAQDPHWRNGIFSLRVLWNTENFQLKFWLLSPALFVLWNLEPK